MRTEILWTQLTSLCSSNCIYHKSTPRTSDVTCSRCWNLKNEFLYFCFSCPLLISCPLKALDASATQRRKGRTAPGNCGDQSEGQSILMQGLSVHYYCLLAVLAFANHHVAHNYGLCSVKSLRGYCSSDVVVCSRE
eukprot:scaffold101838_cov43-Prasinocladus_malaysianus.AAC.2